MDSIDESGASATSELSKLEKIERAKQRMLAQVADSRVDTVESRVAWILNHRPRTRDSDLELQFEYWLTFQPEIFNGRSLRVEDLRSLARLTTITRARAKVQNTYGLFKASEAVRRRRGSLADEERTKHAEDEWPETAYTVYSDESGKNGDYLVVGSVWILSADTSLALSAALRSWRQETGYTDELHFSSISETNLGRYREVLRLLYAHSSAVSFRAVTLPRKGLGNVAQGLEDMLAHLLIRGVEHENLSGRAVLPRQLVLWKDAEQAAQDRLTLLNLRTRMEMAATSRFAGRLRLGTFLAHDSRAVDFLQFADLFAGAVGRRLNAPSFPPKAKDLYAAEFLQAFGLRESSSDLQDAVVLDAL